MKAGPYIFILVFLIMVAGAMAKDAPQIGGLLAIETPKLTYYLSGDYDFKAYTHVFNSTGYLMDNSSVVCDIEVFNISASKIYAADALYDGHDFYWIIPAAATNTPGEYAFMVHCSNGGEAGYISYTFEFRRENPITRDIGGSPLAIIILLPLIFGIMLMVGSFQLDDDHKIIKIIMFLFAYIMVFMSFWFAMQTITNYYEFSGMQGSISTMAWITGIALFVILSYFLIYAFVMGIHIAAQKKKERLGY